MSLVDLVDLLEVREVLGHLLDVGRARVEAASTCLLYTSPSPRDS